ncbi:hypothetical protein GM661_07490 [Iocasia frigidifontis]|uniref:L-2-amino-thiazoline-4-carboxylic acid hydrolase n=1 Tax=Iocasia fonsfrigidae TaxID=2682810 RepID=A0A8A7KIY5_9FIRM|nr:MULTISPECIES: L-2-amino-thiazoline-4-carboxylic acid hydrolase [Halanaerobiaceae]AZO94917.1 hypothetical protein D7D81_10110 [Halocella sp. SP3-1]QTL97842.1 hypothetical protein GM661_07490 [Iocasia fonsfrigidae]
MSSGWEADDVISVIDSLKQNYGEEALEIVEKALYKSAYDYGKELRENDYPNINPSNYVKHFLENDSEEIEVILDSKNKAIIKTNKCMIADIFQSLGRPEIGSRFKCKQDFAIAKGYDQNMELIISKSFMQEDDCCIHEYVKKTDK